MIRNLFLLYSELASKKSAGIFTNSSRIISIEGFTDIASEIISANLSLSTAKACPAGTLLFKAEFIIRLSKSFIS